MAQRSDCERAPVGLRAALGSNCVSCIGHHVPLARTVGLNDEEVAATAGGFSCENMNVR